MTCEKLDSDFFATILAMIVSLRHLLGSYTRRMNDLRKTGFRFFRYNSCHDCVASPSPRVDRQLFSLPRGPRPRKLGSPPATARFARLTASHSIDCPAQAVLGCVENVLVW